MRPSLLRELALASCLGVVQQTYAATPQSSPESGTCGTEHGVFHRVHDSLSVCTEHVKVMTIIVGRDAALAHCQACTGRAADDCSKCVTVVGPCASHCTSPVTSTITHGDLPTVLILTPTAAADAPSHPLGLASFSKASLAPVAGTNTASSESISSSAHLFPSSMNTVFSGNIASSATSGTMAYPGTSEPITSSSRPVASGIPGFPGIIGNFALLGCLASPGGFPSFSLRQSSASMALGLCAKLCDGSNLFGINGYDCYCGQTFDVSAIIRVPIEKCSTRCPGNPDEFCGSSRLRRRQSVPEGTLMTTYVLPAAMPSFIATDISATKTTSSDNNSASSFLSTLSLNSLSSGSSSLHVSVSVTSGPTSTLASSSADPSLRSISISSSSSSAQFSSSSAGSLVQTVSSNDQISSSLSSFSTGTLLSSTPASPSSRSSLLSSSSSSSQVGTGSLNGTTSSSSSIISTTTLSSSILSSSSNTASISTSPSSAQIISESSSGPAISSLRTLISTTPGFSSLTIAPPDSITVDTPTFTSTITYLSTQLMINGTQTAPEANTPTNTPVISAVNATASLIESPASTPVGSPSTPVTYSQDNTTAPANTPTPTPFTTPNPTSNSTSSTSPLPTFACDKNAYAVEQNSLWEWNTTTGQNMKRIVASMGPDGVLAVALSYNMLDNYIYALGQNGSNPALVLKTDSNGNYTIISHMLTGDLWNTGDIDGNGQMWVLSRDNTVWGHIDLNPSSGTYGQVAQGSVSTTPESPMRDAAFINGGSDLWGVSRDSNNNSLLIKFSTTTKALTTVANYGAITSRNWFSAYTSGDQLWMTFNSPPPSQLWSFSVLNPSAAPKQLLSNTPGYMQGGANCATGQNS